MKEKIIKIIAKTLVVDESKVSLESHLINDLGADSLSAFEIVMELENHFGITIQDNEVDTIVKVKDIIGIIEAKYI